MPAASCPRCCNAKRPKKAICATPSPCGVEMPSTPHSSRGASSTSCRPIDTGTPTADSAGCMVHLAVGVGDLRRFVRFVLGDALAQLVIVQGRHLRRGEPGVG